MRSDQVEIRLSEIGKIVGGATPSTKHSEYYDGNIAWITPKDLSGHDSRWISCGKRNITQKGFSSCSTQMLPEGSILFSSRAPIGYVAIAKNTLCTNQGFKSIVPDEKIVNPLFVYYLLKFYTPHIEATASGTTFKEVSGANMKNFKVIIPKSIKTQEKIAELLGSLDDKIELNNEIIKTLEESSSAMYEKTIENATKIIQLHEFCSIQNKKEKIENIDIETYLSTENILPYKKGTKLASSTPPYGSVTQYLKGDTLVSNIRPYFKKITFANRNGSCSNDVICFRAKNDTYKSFLYFTLWQNKFFDYMTQGAKGTKMPRGDKQHIMKYKIPIPDNELMIRFLDFADKALIAISNLRSENRTIEQIRDICLPKLMSGEIEL